VGRANVGGDAVHRIPVQHSEPSPQAGRPSMIRSVRRTLALALGPVAVLAAQSTKAPPAAMSLIREADLKRDMYALAGDDMGGREAGTLDEMRASMWLADEMRKIGLTPRGEGGSWFQWWNMRRTRIATGSSSVQLRGHTYTLWTDITPTSNAAADISSTTVFV